MVAVDGNEWGLECSDTMVEVEEGSDEDGQRTEEVHNVIPEDSKYDN